MHHLFPWEKLGKSDKPTKSLDGCGCGCFECYTERSDKKNARTPDRQPQPDRSRMSGITLSFGLVSKIVVAAAAAGPQPQPEDLGSSLTLCEMYRLILAWLRTKDCQTPWPASRSPRSLESSVRENETSQHRPRHKTKRPRVDIKSPVTPGVTHGQKKIYIKPTEYFKT